MMETSGAEGLSLSSRAGSSHLKAARLVAELHQRTLFDTSTLLRDLIASAPEWVPGARYAGITVTKKKRHSETAAASHHYCVLLDEVQNHCQQGPCLTAAGLQRAVRIDDLARDDRWPLFREKAIAETPVRSILSLGLLKEGGTAAALNFYAESTRAFDDASADLGSVFATHAGLVWDLVRRDQQFRAALVSRDIIGQAKGKLMERFGIDADEAFNALKRLSQHSNTPIAQVAKRVVSGDVQLPPSGSGR
jgi:ANTAR domain/GAF domain